MKDTKKYKDDISRNILVEVQNNYKLIRKILEEKSIDSFIYKYLEGLLNSYKLVMRHVKKRDFVNSATLKLLSDMTSNNILILEFILDVHIDKVTTDDKDAIKSNSTILPEDIINLKILLNTTRSVDDFLKNI